MGWTMSTTRRTLAIGLAGAAIASPALAQNSYNVHAEGKVTKATKVTRTSAQLNGFVQNATGQKSRLVFRIGKRVLTTRWSTSRLPRKVSAKATGLRPRTTYRVTGQVQAYVLCKGTKRKPCRNKFTVKSRPAGSVSFTTKA